MIFSDRMIRVFVVGSILLVAQAVSAFAEKVTLACSQGTGYMTAYYTFDMEAKTVMMPQGGPYTIQVTDDEIYWKEQHGVFVTFVYNRNTARLVTYDPVNGNYSIDCHKAPPRPL
jgi:hypothetical protein